MSTTFQIADMTIHRIVEQEGPLFPAQTMLATLTDEVLAENRSWLQPWAMDAEGKFILAIQSYVVRTPHHTILIDSCVGNDKDRPGRPAWDRKTDTTYMTALAAAGVSVEDIDYVMCTHLHVDHVGWNTRLLDGRWVPTFPNARYVFDQGEYAYWEGQHATAPSTVFADSVLPIVEAKRADLVGDGFGLGDHVRLLPTPGHTPGHVAIQLGRGRDEAVVSGDLMHVPLQVRYPELSPGFDVDPVLSAKTRRAFLERYCDTETLCCTIHFPSPSVGRIRRWGDGFKCEMVG
jgi:glyoxylase-like metal-dependent hydrolase (beta-lactamase superfamily II)